MQVSIPLAESSQRFCSAAGKNIEISNNQLTAARSVDDVIELVPVVIKTEISLIPFKEKSLLKEHVFKFLAVIFYVSF